MGYASDPPSYSTKALPIHLLHGMLNVVFHLSRILILLARLYFEFYFLMTFHPRMFIMANIGLEPMTFALLARHSNQLS